MLEILKRRDSELDLDSCDYVMEKVEVEEAHWS